MPRVAAVLFDLDGTLVDSAPDLAGTANDMRVQRGLPPLPYDSLRPHAGSGARGMLGAAFGLRPGEAGYDGGRLEFLERYQLRLLQQSAAFTEVLPVLQALAQAALPWGIVTNKALRMAVPLANGLGLLAEGRVLVGGDSTRFIKPLPAPLLEAARRLAVAPEDCLYAVSYTHLLRQADLGVAHRRGVVAVDAAEVPLAVHQHVAQREVLRLSLIHI